MRVVGVDAVEVADAELLDGPGLEQLLECVVHRRRGSRGPAKMPRSQREPRGSPRVRGVGVLGRPPSWPGAIRTGEVSSREALDHLLDRVAALDGPINSVVTIDAERARREADAADAGAGARARCAGPLHGVPMTIKDSSQTAGMRTTSGAPELADHVPDEDAWPVARLREAGAVVFGKTNLPIYAGDLQSYNEVFGTTNNPYDRAAHARAARRAARPPPSPAGSRRSSWAATSAARSASRRTCRA